MIRNISLLFLCSVVIGGALVWVNIRPAANIHYELDTLPISATSTSISTQNVPNPKSSGLLLVNVGDIMFDRGIRKSMKEGLEPLSTMPSIKRAVGLAFGKDVGLTIANLEGPITDNPACQNKAYTFKFASNTAEMIKQSGIDLVNLSNNHSFDCFAKGLVDTRKHLDEVGMLYAGGGGQIENSVVRFEQDGMTIAVVGIDQTVAPIPLEKFYPYVAKLASTTDLVVVNIHWGIEYSTTSNKIQKEIGRKLIDSGALAVIGHHPHVVEPVERYKNGIIYYSLGNFIFDQIGEEMNKGGLAALLFEKIDSKVVIKVAKLFPIRINKGLPDLAK